MTGGNLSVAEAMRTCAPQKWTELIIGAPSEQRNAEAKAVENLLHFVNETRRGEERVKRSPRLETREESVS